MKENPECQYKGYELEVCGCEIKTGIGITGINRFINSRCKVHFKGWFWE